MTEEEKKEKRKEYQKQYYLKNKERLTKYKKRYYQKQKGEVQYNYEFTTWTSFREMDGK